MYSAAKRFVDNIFFPVKTVPAAKDYAIETARAFAGAGVNRANEMLATQYGMAALSGFETTASLAEKYLDYYFPATQEELQEESGNVIYLMK